MMFKLRGPQEGKTLCFLAPSGSLSNQGLAGGAGRSNTCVIRKEKKKRNTTITGNTWVSATLTVERYVDFTNYHVKNRACSLEHRWEKGSAA